MDALRMRYTVLWCALAASYSAREGCWLFSALVCPRWPLQYLYTYQYPRGAHASWATIITERDWYSYLSISRYLGMALVAREAYGRLPLFDYLFPPIT